MAKAKNHPRRKTNQKARRKEKLPRTENRSQVHDIQQSMQLAIGHHGAGRLPEAEQICRQILQSTPDHPIALYLLGVIALQVGKGAVAIDLITKAVALKPDFPEAYSNLGAAHGSLGNLDEAVACHRKAISYKPDYAEAHYNLGNTLKRLGRMEDAVASFRKVTEINPEFVEAHNNLGNALTELGELDEAVASYQRALAIRPNQAKSHNNLGRAHFELGDMDRAEACYRKALVVDPGLAEAHNNLGVLLNRKGNREAAVASLQTALTLHPDYADAHNNLGTVLNDSMKFVEAVDCFRRALTINPDFAESNNNLGIALNYLGKLDEAVECYHKALATNPGFAEAYNHLGNALRDQGKLDKSVECFHKAISIKPDYSEAYNNLGNALQDMGQLDESVANYKITLTLKPDDARVHSNILLTEQYRPGHNAETLFDLHRKWDERHGRGFRSVRLEHPNTPEPDRRLRIGFVSPDLRRHPVGYFIIGLMENLPKSEIETVCYSDGKNDDLTRRIMAATGIWRNVCGVSDKILNKMISEDEIDILVDLTGHSANNRLLVFARKPAPLQVTWAGYVGTTGLSAIDYLLTDVYSTHENEEHYYSEGILRMPDGWLCYDPPSYAPLVGPSPFMRKEAVTFSSFNNPAKINEDVVSIWARILHGVTNSTLFLKYRSMDSTANTERLMALFAASGIPQSRLVLEGASPHEDLLGLYNEVDIALDPFPYSGGLTTYEALWMGVPVITVPGETFASRHSLSHLSTLGLQELIARNNDDYVKLAIELANDGERLAGLRAGLREKMRHSPICDGKKFAIGFAEIMRDIWGKWCSTKVSQNIR